MCSRFGVARRCAPFVATVAIALITAGTASATTTYATTYLAGSGGVDTGTASDSNSCNSESTPCQTLAGALAETSSGGTIELSGTLSENAATPVDQDVTIEANPDGTSAAIQGSGATNGLLTIGASIVTIDGVTFSDGNNSTNVSGGGAITNNSGGTLTVNQSTFADNTTSANGGAIANGAGGTRGTGASGTLTVTGSTFTDNSDPNHYGAAIASGTYASGTAVISDSTFTGNTASSDGGGTIDNGSYGSGTLTVSGSTFADNLTHSVGGAIGSWDGTNVLTTVSDSTFTGNTASYGGAMFSSGSNNAMVVMDSTFEANSSSESGGAIENALDAESNLTLVGSTLTGDSSPLGAEIDAGALGGTGQNYVAGDLIDGACNTGATVGWSDFGYNAVTDSSCVGGSAGTGDVISADAGDLGTLADNGGPTQTIGLMAGNPAIDLIPHGTSLSVPAGSSTVSFACPVSADQRGVANPGTAGCDAGALQYAAQTISFGSAPSSAVVGQSADTLNATSSSSLAVGYAVDASTTNSACGISGATVSFAHAGSCVLDASQAGDNNYAAAQVQDTITVAPASTSTALAIGSSALTASVSATAPGGGTPSGTVTFETGGNTIGSAALVGGVATLSYSVPANTTEQITASYAGSADYLSSSNSASRSGPTVQTPTTTTTTPATTSTPTPPVVKRPVIDPTIRAHVHSAAAKGRSGWWRSPVTISFSCTTHGSPLVGGCPKAVTLSHSGRHLSVTRRIKARNGGRAKLTVSGINIDLSRPSVTISGPRPHLAYTLRVPVARCSASDNVSGVRSCRLHESIAQTPRGEQLTYVATATSNAGATASSRETISVSTIALLGAAPIGRAYTVNPGASYVLEVLSHSQPSYLDASVAPLTPRGAHHYFTRDGEVGGVPLWRLDVRIEPGLATYSLWNIGVLVDGNMHTLKLRT